MIGLLWFGSNKGANNGAVLVIRAMELIHFIGFLPLMNRRYSAGNSGCGKPQSYKPYKVFSIIPEIINWQFSERRQTNVTVDGKEV